jgi:hypothetical protein
MPAEKLRPFAVGGALRPDSFTGLSPGFVGSLANLFTNAPPEIQQGLRITSGFRSPERQAQLYQAALAKYGSEQAARKWVAPPGRSQHNMGGAVDLKFMSPAAKQWAHANAGQFGLHFPMKHEPWHIEPIGARGGMQPGRALPMMAQAGSPQPVTPGFQMAPQGGPSPAAMASLAQMYQMQQADDQARQEREAEEEAVAARRRALFGGPSPFG